MASVGHVRDLPGSKEGGPPIREKASPRPARGHRRRRPLRRPLCGARTKKKVVAELKAALKNADELILATDEDREGEAIGWHVREVLQPKVPVRRMVFHEITPTAIREALENSARSST